MSKRRRTATRVKQAAPTAAATAVIEPPVVEEAPEAPPVEAPVLGAPADAEKWSPWLFAWQVFLCLAIFAVLLHMHTMVRRTVSLVRDGGIEEGPPAVQVRGEPGKMPSQPPSAPQGGMPRPPPGQQTPTPPPETRPPPDTGITTLPLGEILAGVRDLARLPRTDRSRLTKQQARKLLPVVETSGKITANADAILQSGITKVYVVLTSEQKRFIEDHPPRTIHDVGDPNNPSGDPLGARLIKMLESRAGVKSQALPAAVPIPPVPMATANPQLYREGLIVLELDPKAPKLTPQQARDLLPYIRDDMRINATQIQTAHAIVKVLTPAQRDRIMSMHTQNSIRNVPPMVAIIELRALIQGR